MPEPFDDEQAERSQDTPRHDRSVDPARDIGPSAPGLRGLDLARGGETDVKELRVKIDVSYHLKLHALKLLRNKKMSDAIEEALDHYFAHVVNEQQQLDGEDAMKRLF